MSENTCLVLLQLLETIESVSIGLCFIYGLHMVKEIRK